MYVTDVLHQVFSGLFKIQEIKPVFKNGDRNDISNYRPIALLNSFSNVLEKVIYQRLCQHINNNVLYPKNSMTF
jgi:hypothetical protein